MNSENSKTSKPHVLILKLTGKLDFRRGEKSTAYRILIFNTHGKTWKAHTKKKNLKYKLKLGMIDLKYQVDYILYQIFKIILSIFWKNVMKRLITRRQEYM